MNDDAKSATLYRMVLDDHVCPWGVKSLELLESEGFAVDDRHLTTREEVDSFEEKWNVATTPQTFIDDERIGGFEDLSAYLAEQDS